MRILYVTDIHYDSTPDKPHYKYAVKYQEAFWSFLKENINRYDLFVAGGDLTVKGPACIEELYGFKQKVENITSDYIATPGNHDLCPIKGMEKTYPGVEEYEYTELDNVNFSKVFGEAGLRYSEVFEDIRLIAFAIRNEDPDDQLVWLEKELKKSGKKIVFSHYPVFQTRSGGFCAGWDYNRIGKSREKIASLLADEQHDVLFYFCGHQHINSKVPMNMDSDGKPELNINYATKGDGKRWQVETGTLTQATVCYREIEIEKDRISVSTKQLPGISGLVEGVMNETKSFDETHSDIYTYHMGNEDERDFEVNL